MNNFTEKDRFHRNLLMLAHSRHCDRWHLHDRLLREDSDRRWQSRAKHQVSDRKIVQLYPLKKAYNP